MKPFLQERFSECGNSIMAKHQLTTFRQRDLPMHEYITKFSDLVEHAYTLSPTDPASMILASNFIEGIMNPYIRNKLRSCKISNLQDMFKFTFEEDQKQKIRALDFETKPDTIAHCYIQAIKGSTCHKCVNEGHFIKDCPLLQNNPTHHHNPTPNHKLLYAPHCRSNSNNTDMLTPITQALSNLLEQLKQLFMTNTNSFGISSHQKSYHNNTDRNKHKYHNRDTKHNDNYNRNKSYSGNTQNRTHHSRHNHRTRVNKIEEFSECSSDCTCLSDCEEQVNAETPDNMKKLVSPSHNSSSLPVTFRGQEHCLTENRQHASQTVAVKNNSVLDKPVDKSINITANDDTEIVHVHRKSTDECALMVFIGNKHHKALWDPGAGKCFISFDCYKSIPTKYKTELCPCSIKIKDANGIFITKKVWCDLTFVIDDERFTFPFLRSNQLSQQIILGHNFAKASPKGTWWDQDDNMYLSRHGKPFEQTIPSSTINTLVFCTESIVIPPYSNGYIQCKVPKEKLKLWVGIAYLCHHTNIDQIMEIAIHIKALSDLMTVL